VCCFVLLLLSDYLLWLSVHMFFCLSSRLFVACSVIHSIHILLLQSTYLFYLSVSPLICCSACFFICSYSPLFTCSFFFIPSLCPSARLSIHSIPLSISSTVCSMAVLSYRSFAYKHATITISLLRL
jgi:hypothetical protein